MLTDSTGSVRLPRSRRVLIVDDNQDHLSTLAALLRAMGQDVQAATNGASALWLAMRFRPDVIFLDLTMPHMHGYEVARALRAQPDSKDARIVVFTGSDTETQDRARLAGCDDLLRKPVPMSAIARALDSRD